MADIINACEEKILKIAADFPMMDYLTEWANINSGSYNQAGLAVMAEKLKQAFSILPAKIEEVTHPSQAVISAEGVPLSPTTATHLHLTIRPEASLQLLFTGHFDTVFGKDHPFNKVTRLDEETIGGPGVADMKGGLAVMLAALQAFENHPNKDKLGYEIVLNSDEEIGSSSSAPLLTRSAKGKIAAFTYEPSTLPDGTFASARPGSGNFSIVIAGLAAHAGRNIDQGRNAIVAAADMALRLKSASEKGLTVNPAKIDGGGPNNIVPDNAVLRVNIRPSTPEKMQLAENLLKKTIADIAQDHSVTVKIYGHFGRPPKAISQKGKNLMALVESSCQDLGLTARWQETGGVCDGNNISAMDVPVIDTMGVRGGNIHSQKEFMVIKSLEERAQLSALILIRLLDMGGI